MKVWNLKGYVFALALVSITVCAVCAYSKDVEDDLRSGIIRLHIVADSDSEDDQAVKLKVRDAVLEAVKKDEPESEAEFAETAEKTAEKVLEENGYSYGAEAEYGIFTFPEKSYRGLTLPAGEYEGVRIILGSGEGRNWWCVMYPPLCVTDGEPELDEDADSVLKSRLRPDTYDVISDGDGVKIRFKTIELLRAVIGAVNGDE